MTRYLTCFPVRCVGLLAGLWFALSGVRADDPEKPKEEPREAVARVVTPPLLFRASKDKEWGALKAKGDVFSTDVVLALPGIRGQIESADGLARLMLWGSVPEHSIAPVMESMIVLHKGSTPGLDFTLRRGRVVLAGKGKEPAQARVHVNDKVFYDVRLGDKDSEAALEMYRRWPLGSPFSTNPRKRRPPQEILVVFALKGKCYLKAGGEQYLMSAPSTFQWDNYGGPDPKPSKAPKVPAWAEGLPNTPEAKQMEAAAQRLEKRLLDQPPEKAIADGLASPNATDRKLSIYAYAALDDYPRLAEALSDAKRADVRVAAIIALHHWMGQALENDSKLYGFLVKEWGYSTEQSEIVLQLLHGFRDVDIDRPETYETLIEYLRHRKRSIRELARWHLYRLAIAGRQIPYDAAASSDAIEKAYKAWKALVPNGKLPPKPEDK